MAVGVDKAGHQQIAAAVDHPLGEKAFGNIPDEGDQLVRNAEAAGNDFPVAKGCAHW